MDNTSKNLVLGIDCSTQSMTGVILNIQNEKVQIHAEKSIVFTEDPRTNCFGIHPELLILPSSEEGQAEQPPEMFLAALDALLHDFKKDGAELNSLSALQISAQQHGHVYIKESARRAFQSLTAAAWAAGEAEQGRTLTDIFENTFSYPSCPIWLSSNTSEEASALREAMGGSERMIRESGSDSPLRFSGAVIRRIGRKHPELYAQTAGIRLLSSYLSGVLCGQMDVPADWGNASGMSLMAYTRRSWSPALLDAAAEGLPGGTAALSAKLGGLAHPLSRAGSIAAYFSYRYGIPPHCLVGIGSGDNPQSKAAVQGELLSLGTSFVYMIEQEQAGVDLQGYANSMYDGLGRPFIFACRTNGAAVWDAICKKHEVPRKDYETREKALQSVSAGSELVLWQPRMESFPLSREFEIQRTGKADFAADYSGLIDSSLGILYLYSRSLSDSQEPMKITGGPSSSPEICKRAASIWQRPVIRIAGSGAAYGAALAGYAALLNEKIGTKAAQAAVSVLLEEKERFEPDPGMVAAYHSGDKSYLSRLAETFESIGSIQ